MLRTWLSSLRARLILLVLFALLPALALILYTGLDQRRSAAQQASDEALRLANIASYNQEIFVGQVRGMLKTLSLLPQIREASPSECSQLLALLEPSYPSMVNLGVADLDGNVLCSAVPLSGPINIADRQYFQQALQTRDFGIGVYQIGRATGVPSINFGYPVLDEQGQPRAVVFAAVGLDWLNQLVADAQLPEGATFSVIDRQGTVLARIPDSQTWVGKSVPETQIFQAIQRQHGEGTATVAGLDEVTRLYGFSPLGGVPQSSVYVSVGIPTAVAYAEADQALTRNLAGLGIIAVLTLVAAWSAADLFVLRRTRSLVEASRRLAAGDLSARTGLPYGQGELSLLAQTFDEMAESIAKREAERAREEERFRSVTEASLAGVCIIQDDKFRYVNPVMAQTFGYSVEEVVDHLGPLDLVHPHDRPTAMENIRRRIQGEVDAVRYTFRAIRKDGAVLYLEALGRRWTYAGRPAIIGTWIDVTERIQAEERLERQLFRLESLRTIDAAIASSLDLGVTLNVLLDQVTTQLKVDAADVLLLNPHSQMLEHAGARGFRTEALKHTHLRLGEGYAGQVALKKSPIRIPALSEAPDGLQRAPLLPAEGFAAYYGMPLIAKGTVKGVLEIFHRSPLEPDREWEEFLDTLAGEAALAIDTAELFLDLQRSNLDLTLAYDATIEGWSRALDLRDEETEGHTQRVTEMTERLARALGVEGEALVHVRRGALLHDIGKMGVPDAILLKPGSLTEEEWVIMRKHPTSAFEMLSPITYLRQALDIPYCHHEKWDGTGYPRGLKGEEISLSARAFAVVDVWDALRSDRPYRPGWPEEKVLEHIREQSSKHFDPRAVEAFFRVLKEPEGTNP